MNEVISRVNYGTDIHGLKNPIYFASVWGQGQSVLYSWIVIPVVKIFGFSILSFRLPIAILTIITIISIIAAIYLSSKEKLLAVCITVSLVTTPWLFVSSRWVLDANISPIFVILGLVSMYGSMARSYKVERYILLMCSAILLSLSAYGYIAAWIYLPFLIVILFVTGIIKRWFSLREMLFWAAIIFVFAFPLIIFAYRVNIQHVTKFSTFMFFGFPYLQANRVGSLISFDGSILSNIRVNIDMGIKQVLLGTDSLPQNSVAPYGAIFPFMTIFTVLGVFAKKSFFSESAINFRVIILEALFSFIPGIMIIRPNYNHWNFIWFPLAILTGYGLYAAFKMLHRVSWRVLLAVPVLVFYVFVFNSYFGVDHEKTYFNSSLGSVEETRTVDRMMVKRYKHDHLYIESLSETFDMFRLVRNPINDSQYLKMVKDAKGKNGSIIPAPVNSYGYLRSVDNISKASTGDLTMIYEDDLNNQGSFLATNHKWHFVKNLRFNHRNVKIFRME
ncbi:hypothetical protein [Companilactobacillus keshanensis]|uniref:Glycosyltransferase RgtA/B/C/D-like domain-containing protein n=1 Tax=Companilactobacillus keshanensis TaxID=2486003 RepID=A0ABW4BQP8_9LACO|nr:hypothetical protein [Companilactobacillus keshanensis]